MTVVATVLGAQVRQLIFDLDVVDTNSALLQQPFHKNVPQRDVLCARTVGSIAGDVLLRRVVDVPWHAAEAHAEAQLQNHVGAEYHLLHCRSFRREFCLHRYCLVNPPSPTLKLIGALASITIYDDVHLPLSGLLPQFASKKANSLKPTCLQIMEKSVDPVK